MAKKRIMEVMSTNAEKICDLIESDMKKSPYGIDPREYFTLGTLNVISELAIGRVYDFEEPAFKKIGSSVKEFFDYLTVSFLVFRRFINVMPMFIVRSRVFLDLTYYLFPIVKKLYS